jgi:hypothetical protein
MGKLQTMAPRRVFGVGLLLILLMPSDVIIMLTTGLNLHRRSLGFVEAIPFIALTVAIAALPLIFYVLFRHRAMRAMPRVRDWMNDNSWLVNIIVYGIFIVLIVA